MHWTEPYFEQAYLKRWSSGPPSPAAHAEAADLLALLSPPPELPLLDVGCGHGRYAMALASHGRRVIGLDASRALLQLAARQGTTTPAPPRWVRGDMRGLPLARMFGGAVLLDSFGFFDADDQNACVLLELRRVLVPKGRLVITVVNGTPILTKFRPRDVERRGTVVIEIQRTLQRRPAQLVETIIVQEPSGITQYERRQRLYSHAELTGLLDATGFIVRGVSADYAGGSFDEGASSKVVLLAEAAA